MQDNFNLTGWVRNKRLLRESENSVSDYQSGWETARSQRTNAANYKQDKFEYKCDGDKLLIRLDMSGIEKVITIVRDGDFYTANLGKVEKSGSDIYLKVGLNDLIITNLIQKCFGNVSEEDMNEEVDGFENSDNLPEDVKELLDMWSDKLSHGKGGYDAVGEMLDDFENLGWTFDFGLDGEPYNLRPINGDQNEMNENQADWERFYEEGYLAGYAACQRGVPNRFASGDEDMPASDYSARRNSEKY